MPEGDYGRGDVIDVSSGDEVYDRERGDDEGDEDCKDGGRYGVDQPVVAFEFG